MSESPTDDLLSALLRAYHVSATVFAQPLVCGGWRIDTNGVAPAQFHLLVSGTCFLQMKHLHRPVPMRPGDLVLVPNGAWHILSAHPLAEEDPEAMPNGAPAQLVCASLAIPDVARRALFGFLPQAIVVRASETNERFGRMIQLIGAEASASEPGAQCVLESLANGLLAMCLREHFRHLPGDEQLGILAAANDLRLRPLIAALHRDPGQPWTVEAMLRIAPMSRSALMDRFKQLMGDSPMGYVTQLRMIVARRLLATPASAGPSVAERVGYENEAAFRRAYRRFCATERGLVDDGCRSSDGPRHTAPSAAIP